MVCPECQGRGRKVRRTLEGKPLPEEEVELPQLGSFQFLDPCDHCEGRRVVPEVELESIGSLELDLLRDRARRLERVEEGLRPYLASWQEPEDPWSDGIPF